MRDACTRVDNLSTRVQACVDTCIYLCTLWKALYKHRDHRPHKRALTTSFLAHIEPLGLNTVKTRSVPTHRTIVWDVHTLGIFPRLQSDEKPKQILPGLSTVGQ